MDKNDQLLRAVQTATRKLASSGHFNALLRDVLAICVDAVGASGGTIYVHDPAKKLLKFQHVLPEEVADKMPFDGIPDDAGVAGKVFRTRQTQINYFEHSDENTRKEVESATGVFVRTMITVPLMMEDEQPIGIVQLINKKSGDFDETDVAVLDTVAAVSTMAYLNSRLTEESTRASTLLGMGKVSHDIGNLAASLYANISFSELAMDGMRDHLKEIGASDTSEMYLESLDSMFIELKASVDRIVGYSRLISDLSAGRELRPNKIMAPLSDTIQTSAAYLESEGRKNRVALLYDIQTGTPPLLHDELYLFRIVQNLVGNAIKAVRETVPEDWEQQLDSDDDAIFGEVVVRYRYNDPDHVVEVQDSGPGMKPDVAEKILLGTARSEWDRGGGSGWGTKIVLELAATHKAKVSIDSELGKGSIF
ncbi:MAG TPA: GAF domain-containing sensor histidine kinase, partial [Fimbriimonadaceae bacterium]|nr:GAF domain-containing sensor histidine kinase [Fimbriimonadaceae bacterium]